MPIGFNAYPWSVLPDSHWEALYRANAELIDEILDDLAQLAQGAGFASTAIAAYLPRAYRHRYDEPFLRRFLVCLVSVGSKLRLPGFHPLGCTAEELALYATKLRAGELLEEEGESAEFGDWDDLALEDTDHELLYRPAFDGIEHTAQAQSMALAHLSFEEWFLPFEPPCTVHPYSDPDDEAWAADRALYEEDEAADDEDGEDGGVE